MSSSYEYYTKAVITKELLDSIKIGDRIICNDWTTALTVSGVSDNYFIMYRKLKKCPSYTNGIEYSICKKIKTEYTNNYLTPDYFSIGTDNSTFNQYDHSKEQDTIIILKQLEQGKIQLSASAINLETIRIRRVKHIN